jgi:hypothetical protein
MAINAPGAKATPQNGQTTKKLVMKPLKRTCCGQRRGASARLVHAHSQHTPPPGVPEQDGVHYACLNRVCVSWEQYVLCGQPRAILHVTPGRYCALANARVGSCNIHLTSRDYLQVVAFMPVSFGFFMAACLA